MPGHALGEAGGQVVVHVVFVLHRNVRQLQRARLRPAGGLRAVGAALQAASSVAAAMMASVVLAVRNMVVSSFYE
ncbi:hypothetical protein NB2BOR_A34920 [Bordetella parapertussis]|nr:hypothetical protein NB2BOR_A34920 [Bordetella parapertussis]